MELQKALSLLFLTTLLLNACAQGPAEETQADTPPTPQASNTPHPTQDWSQVPSHQARVIITTSSDWTTIRLREGLWHSLSVISTSDQAQLGEINQDQIQLGQPLSRAEAGKEVELVLEVYFAELERGATLVFEIERGHIGSSKVEIQQVLEEGPRTITQFSWDGAQTAGSNSQRYEVAADAFLDPAPNEYIVIAQLNFWYYGPGPHGGFENDDGSRSTPFVPLLGSTYNAGDPDVVYQQIEWAVDYGVDAFSIEWTTPRGVGCCGSMEDTLDDVFLKSPNLHKIRWAIFYDFILRLGQTEELGWDFSDPVNFNQPLIYETFVDDFVHFAEKYFSHPQYLTIDGRPVIYIWATNNYQGNFAGAVAEARSRLAELGYDVFIVGDEVCISCFRPNHAALFDGSSTFTFLIPGIENHLAPDVGEAAEAVDWAFTWWRNQIKDLSVTGREDPVVFQSAWAPQYDESWINTIPNPFQVPAESKEQVLEMARVARKHAEPAGEEQLKLIWLNTWNCWGESTTVEPTIDQGAKYPTGNYGFDMLEVVEEVFGSETYYTSPGP